MTKQTLPEEVAKFFDCDQTPGMIITRAPDRKRVDLTKISLDQAKKLHAEGLLPMLKPRVDTLKKRNVGAVSTEAIQRAEDSIDSNRVAGR